MFKFKPIAIIVLSLIGLRSNAQNIQAAYWIEKEMNIGDKGKTTSLNLTGHYYKKGNKYIYWESADYLAKYPDAKIVINKDNNYNIYELNPDTVQTLFYHDYDSLIVKQGLFNQYQRPITKFKFEADRSLPWTFETNTKVINGLKCQLATWGDQWRVWFCPDIPAKTSLSGLQGLPGLAVEADLLPLNAHYSLLSYDMEAIINDAVFKPAAFKQPMTYGGLLKSIKANPEKTKQQKKQDLIDQ